MAEHRLDRIEKRIPNAGGQADDRALDHAAHRIALLFGREDRLPHSRASVQHRQFLPGEPLKGPLGTGFNLQRPVLHRMDRKDVRADHDALAL